jgi:hypothetical protein
MQRFYLIFGILALSLFSYAQYRGAGLFDDVAKGPATRPGQASRNTFHK